MIIKGFFVCSSLLVPVISCLSRNEAPIPTHFFVILTSCGNSTFSPVNCKGPLQAKSFILPHRPDHTESCAVSNTPTTPPSVYLCGNLLTNPTMEKNIKAEKFLNRSPINRFFLKLLFRLGQTWRGWRTGYIFTPLGSETSSSWPVWASTTTGYQWKRRYSSRRFYLLLKIRHFQVKL